MNGPGPGQVSVGQDILGRFSMDQIASSPVGIRGNFRTAAVLGHALEQVAGLQDVELGPVAVMGFLAARDK